MARASRPPVRVRRRIIEPVLRLWLIKLMPFMARWQDTAPAACCGMCGPCLTATATGLSLEVVGVKKFGEPEQTDAEPAAEAGSPRR
jgi:hypothetical protein